MSATATPPTPAIPWPTAGPSAGLLARLKRYTVAEYHDLIGRGIIPERDRLALVEGYLVEQEPMNPPHSATLKRLRRAVDPLLPPLWDDRVQDAIALPDSVPLPDYVAVRTRADDYDGRHPGPADIGLLVEVADSSLADDRNDAQRIYARAGIVLYWIVNIPGRQIEVYTDPDPSATPPAYRTRTTYRPGDSVPVILDGVQVGTVAVADVLP